MNILITIMAIVIVTGGIISQSLSLSTETEQPSETVQGATVATSPTPTPLPGVEETKPNQDESNTGEVDTSVSIVHDSPSIDISVESTGTDSGPSQGGGSEQFMYPGSTFTGNVDGARVYTTADSADTVTAWYKDKITQRGYSATSFVTTTSNDTVLNKLAAASGEHEIEVEVSSSPGSSHTTIKLR